MITKNMNRSPIEVIKVEKSQFDKDGIKTATVKQVVTTTSHYPNASIDNNMQENVFDINDFDVESNDYSNDETRVAFIPVPENTIPGSIVEKLNSFPNACIYKILSTRPILTDNHLAAISNGVTTKDKIAESQVTRYPAGHEREGQIIPWNGLPQYRKTFFWSTLKEDIDNRNVENTFVPDSIKEEMGITVNTEVANVADQNIFGA